MTIWQWLLFLSVWQQSCLTVFIILSGPSDEPQLRSACGMFVCDINPTEEGYFHHVFSGRVLKEISLKWHSVWAEVRVRSVAEPDKCQAWGGVNLATKCYLLRQRNSWQVLIGNHSPLGLILHFFARCTHFIKSLSSWQQLKRWKNCFTDIIWQEKWKENKEN